VSDDQPSMVTTVSPNANNVGPSDNLVDQRQYIGQTSLK
jgi:hypothetical protein